MSHVSTLLNTGGPKLSQPGNRVGEFKVLLTLIGDKYDSDTTNGMVMSCLSESVECSLLAIK